VQSLEELKLIERVKLSYLKNRGNAIAVATETGLSVQLVQKYIRKFRGKESRDVSVLISNTLMQQALFGYQQRTQEANDMLRYLDGSERVLVSACHTFVVKPVCDDSNGPRYKCLKCNKEDVEVIVKEQHDVMRLKIYLMEFLREEDKNMLEFAERMGYTNKKPDVVVQDNRQMLVINGNGGKAVENDPIVVEAKNMLPHEREDLRRQLKKLINGENQVKSNEQKESSTEQPNQS